MPLNPNLNPDSNPNPNPKRGAIFFGGNFPDTKQNRDTNEKTIIKRLLLLESHFFDIETSQLICWNNTEIIKLTTYFMKDLINNWDQLYLSKGHFFHYLTYYYIHMYFILSCRCHYLFFFFVFFFLSTVCFYPSTLSTYSFHHTNLLK